MRILCVDRSPWGLLDLKQKVKSIKPEAEIHGCREPEDALTLAKSDGCDVLLTEIDFGRDKYEGLDFAKNMQRICPTVNIIFVTGFSEWDCAREVIQMRVSGFVQKPFKLERLAEEFTHLRLSDPPATTQCSSMLSDKTKRYK